MVCLYLIEGDGVCVVETIEVIAAKEVGQIFQMLI